ncbi:DUF2087 domain-containing protein [Vagococcus entomophilus]|uniref:DUF2087 domain-containing protein n=1 Tax=Vagococcus entomophilus TaxID=1160095 RepID=UPI001FE7A11D|nr:DUF2087 domain-containing protein [Vagococcus entomophilus]
MVRKELVESWEMKNFSKNTFKMENCDKFRKKNKDKQELFRFFAEQFDDAKIYTEKEINEKLKNFYDDFAIVRRYLVDHGYLLRDQYGKEYRKKIDLAE